jgi:hypothetical protein
MRAKNLTKILGLSLLVAVGVMAVSASAAQAKWLLLRNGASVLLLELKGEVLLGELRVPGLNLNIHCKKGSATAHLELNAGPTPAAHTVLTGTATGVFQECTVLEFSKCTVKSPGAANGEIKASGKGEGKMTGEEVYALVSSKEFASINVEGALCPFEGLIEQPVNGNAKLTVTDPLKDETTKLVKLDDDGLFFGNEPATLEGELLEVGKPRDPWVLAHVKEASNASFAVHLVGL